MEIENQAKPISHNHNQSEFSKIDSLITNYESKLETMLKRVTSTPEKEQADNKKKTRTGKNFPPKNSAFYRRFN